MPPRRNGERRADDRPAAINDVPPPVLPDAPPEPVPPTPVAPLSDDGLTASPLGRIPMNGADIASVPVTPWAIASHQTGGYNGPAGYGIGVCSGVELASTAERANAVTSEVDRFNALRQFSFQRELLENKFESEKRIHGLERELDKKFDDMRRDFASLQAAAAASQAAVVACVTAEGQLTRAQLTANTIQELRDTIADLKSKSPLVAQR